MHVLARQMGTFTGAVGASAARTSHGVGSVFQNRIWAKLGIRNMQIIFITSIRLTKQTSIKENFS